MMKDRPGAVDDGEAWRPIPGYEGFYEVSNLGRVRSHHRGGRILRPCKDRDGYPLVALNRGGVRKTHVLHTIVCCAFNGSPNILHNEVAHLDGTRDNCRADNLKWVSRRENQFHKRAHGTHGAGELNGFARLTTDQAYRIKQAVGPRAEIARAFEISVHTVSDIRSGKRWKHLAASPNPDRLAHKEEGS